MVALSSDDLTGICSQTEQQTNRFQRFRGRYSTANGGEEKPVGLHETETDLKGVEKSLSIDEELASLREIKDIRDELNMMMTVFYQQKGVVQVMDHILQNPRTERNDTSRVPYLQ